jgi:hypothetical protein
LLRAVTRRNLSSIADRSRFIRWREDLTALNERSQSFKRTFPHASMATAHDAESGAAPDLSDGEPRDDVPDRSAPARKPGARFAARP